MARLDVGPSISEKHPGTYVHYEISGYVTEEGQPARKLIILIDNQTRLICDFIESRDSDGYWVRRWHDKVFPDDQSREKRFCVICKDYGGVYNVKGYDWITPVRVVTIIE